MGQQKSRQSKIVVIMQNDLPSNYWYSNTTRRCSLFPTPQQLQKYMSTVILPLFHFKVAQCGIYSQTKAFPRLLRIAAPPPLSRKASNFKWVEYRCQAICICAQHQKHLKVETLDGVLWAQALTFMLKGKLAQNKVSTLIIARTLYTFSWWAGFNLSTTFFFWHSSFDFRWRVYLFIYFPSVGSRRSLRLPRNSGKKLVWVSLILACLDSSRWLSHTSLFLSFFFCPPILLSLSPPR